MADPAIDAAIDAAEQKAHDRSMAEIPLLGQAHAWPPDADITLRAGEGNVPTLLIWDAAEGAYRAVFLAPGSEWRITPLAKPQLWTPAEGKA